MNDRTFPERRRSEKPPINEKRKQSILEQLWLTYYNDTLYTKGVITENEYDQMRVKIKTRAGSVRV